MKDEDDNDDKIVSQYTVTVLMSVLPVPKCGVFYLPLHRTLNTRHSLVLRHMQEIG